jgi:hypothetical protein
MLLVHNYNINWFCFFESKNLHFLFDDEKLLYLKKVMPDFSIDFTRYNPVNWNFRFYTF